MCRILVEDVDAGAQELFRVKARVESPQRIAVAPHQILGFTVNIGDHQLAIDGHHGGLCAVNSAL